VFQGVAEITHPKRQKFAEIDTPFLPKWVVIEKKFFSR
jgi:hypothetical protein